MTLQAKKSIIIKNWIVLGHNEKYCLYTSWKDKAQNYASIWSYRSSNCSAWTPLSQHPLWISSWHSFCDFRLPCWYNYHYSSSKKPGRLCKRCCTCRRMAAWQKGFLQLMTWFKLFQRFGYENKIYGAYTVLITPFTTEGQLDEEGLRCNIRFQIENKIQGLVALGTTGEDPTLTAVEKIASWKSLTRKYKVDATIWSVQGLIRLKTIENTQAAKKPEQIRL